uniref:Uncharacterized protein n=1 Tax=viral metagenome TaxID=1070528 RepID=A0A6C0K5A8_9ZZZZ
MTQEFLNLKNKTMKEKKRENEFVDQYHRDGIGGNGCISSGALWDPECTRKMGGCKNAF